MKYYVGLDVSLKETSICVATPRNKGFLHRRERRNRTESRLGVRG